MKISSEPPTKPLFLWGILKVEIENFKRSSEIFFFKIRALWVRVGPLGNSRSNSRSDSRNGLEAKISAQTLGFFWGGVPRAPAGLVYQNVRPLLVRPEKWDVSQVAFRHTNASFPELRKAFFCLARLAQDTRTSRALVFLSLVFFCFSFSFEIHQARTFLGVWGVRQRSGEGVVRRNGCPRVRFFSAPSGFALKTPETLKVAKKKLTL